MDAKLPLVIGQHPNYEVLRSANQLQERELFLPSLDFLMPRVPPSRRATRLRYDHRVLLDLVARCERFQLLGNAPDLTQYQLKISCNGIRQVEESDRPLIARDHEIMITLPDDYPDARPHIEILTGAFHPNVFPRGFIAFGAWGEVWKPSISVASLCLMVYDILTYNWLNVYSPANVKASAWARENLHNFPLDSSPFLDISEPPDEIGVHN